MDDSIPFRKAKRTMKCRINLNRRFITIPIALLSFAILVLVISALLISATVMQSKLFTNEGHLVDFTERQFYIVVSFSLVAISAVTLGVSTVWIRYRAIVVVLAILLIIPGLAFLHAGMNLNEVTVASEKGIAPICESSGSGSESFDKMFKPFI